MVRASGVGGPKQEPKFEEDWAAALPTGPAMEETQVFAQNPVISLSLDFPLCRQSVLCNLYFLRPDEDEGLSMFCSVKQPEYLGLREGQIKSLLS